MERAKSLKLPIAAGVILLLIVLIGIGVYFVKSKNSQNNSTANSITPTPSVTEKPKYLTYKDSAGKFEFQYPSNWSESPKNEIVKVMFNSSKESEQNADLEYINVATEELTDDKYTVQQYTEYAKYSMPQTFKDFKVLSEEKKTVGGIDAVSLLFTGVNSNKNFKVQQRYVIKDKIVYVITYTAREDSYSMYETEGNYALDSFNFI